METEQGPNHALNRAGFYLFLAAITLAMGYVVGPFAAPLLWAMLAAIMFQPLYQWLLARLGNRPNRAALATLLIITLAVLIPSFIIGSMVLNEAINVVQSFQRGEINVMAWFEQVFSALPRGLQNWLQKVGLTDIEAMQERLRIFFSGSAGKIAQSAVAIGGGVFGFILSFGVGLYVSFFLLRDGQEIGETVISDLPLDNDVARRLSTRFLGIVRATIKGSVVVGFVQGVLGAITFWIVGLPSVALLGMLMAISSMIPAVGTGLVWFPAALWLFATGEIWQGLFVIFSGVAVISMADNVLRPILVGRETGIPDWIILVATLGGIATLGLAGIVLGPLVAGLFLAGWSIVGEQRAQPALAGDSEEE